ncbi:hypothetical protein J2Z21_008781 [Streptomyces griseochromogenes]|uniref:Uncharacterized protein n=1 Tax=Streptomyces griseochromogenes TaxID=68214 RepID=A0ABS4M7V6_9ACTN|nr:hypothetical protein [Streptomyces griseochromogenes]
MISKGCAVPVIQVERKRRRPAAAPARCHPVGPQPNGASAPRARLALHHPRPRPRRGLHAQPVAHQPRAGRLLRPRRQQQPDQRPQVASAVPWPTPPQLTNGVIVVLVMADQHTAARSCHEL